MFLEISENSPFDEIFAVFLHIIFVWVLLGPRVCVHSLRRGFYNAFCAFTFTSLFAQAIDVALYGFALALVCLSFGMEGYLLALPVLRNSLNSFYCPAPIIARQRHYFKIFWAEFLPWCACARSKCVGIGVCVCKCVSVCVCKCVCVWEAYHLFFACSFLLLFCCSFFSF